MSLRISMFMHSSIVKTLVRKSLESLGRLKAGVYRQVTSKIVRMLFNGRSIGTLVTRNCNLFLFTD